MFMKLQYGPKQGQHYSNSTGEKVLVFRLKNAQLRELRKKRLQAGSHKPLLSLAFQS